MPLSSKQREEERRKRELDVLVTQALGCVFLPSEIRLNQASNEVAALAHCIVMETPGWGNITPREIYGSIHRIYMLHVVKAGKQDQPVNWTYNDVLRCLCWYKEKYPELLKNINWWGIC